MAQEVARGDIWLYRFAPPDKRRPVLVLSRDAALRVLETAVVAPISTRIRDLPSEVRVGIGEGLKSDSAINLDHLYTVAKADLRQWVGQLSPAKMDEVCSGVQIALGCD